MGIRRKDRESYGRGVLQQQASSGLSVARFCRQESISAPSLYLWRRKLAERDAAAGQVVPSEKDRSNSVPEAAGRLVAIRIESRETATPVRILLPHGVSIEVPSGIGQSELAELLRTLSEAGPC